MKVLVVRNDGLGDFLLTLPLVSSLKKQWQQKYPDLTVHVLVNQHLLSLAPVLPDIDQMIADEGVLLKRHRQLFSGPDRKKKYETLLQKIRAEKYDLAILPYAEKESARLVFEAGIPSRLGPLRRSFFWRFNRFFSVSRQKSNLPEFRLNLLYLKKLGLDDTFVFPQVSLPPAPDWLPAGPFVILHPYKKSNTALSWPPGHFLELARKLKANGHDLVVIGDQADQPVLASMFASLPEVQNFCHLSLPDLMQLMQKAAVFIGNSSGPLHLAALLKVPHVGFFPLEHVSSRQRWQTLPFQDLLSPETFLLAPEIRINCRICQKEKCPHYNCLEQVSPATAQTAVSAWLTAGKKIQKNG